MPKLRSPIKIQYANNGTTYILNQLFGEHPNQMFYGPLGHSGIDFKTQGSFKWERNFGTWKLTERTEDEKKGFIPLVAAHDGILTNNIYYRDRSLGWAVFINFMDGLDEYRLLYYHIETPWRSLSVLWRGFTGIFKPAEQVRSGAIIAIGGNTGFPRYSTGSHLHFELQKRVNGEWISIDPMPHLTDGNVYQMYRMTSDQWFHMGKEITESEAKEIIKTKLNF